MSKNQHYDVLIVGAGVSGIGAAYYIKENTSKTFAILEKRSTIGGTWGLFKYPGFRNDSSMTLYSYSFHPWTKENHVVSASEILSYLNEVADAYNLRSHIHFNEGVKSADFDSKTSLWTLTMEDGNIYTCQYLFACSGYYDYSSGYFPSFPNIDAFKGEVVHSQKWTESHSFEGKRVAIIGSGATAITLLPALVKGNAAHVTMIQRSPSYIVTLPSRDYFENPVMKFLFFVFGRINIIHILRWVKFIMEYVFYFFCVYCPSLAKASILLLARIQLGMEGSSVYDPHFIPSYKPWEQRLCLCPDGDFFEAARNTDKVTMITDHISSFTESGIDMKGGASVEVDLVLVATGLRLTSLGGISLTVDGIRPEVSKIVLYKGFAPSNIPNFVLFTGYLNTSWTLRVDLIGSYIVRLLKYMDTKKFDKFVAFKGESENFETEPLLNFNSGYIQRARKEGAVPMQGLKSPWRLHQNYFLDYYELKVKGIDDDVMKFSTKK